MSLSRRSLLAGAAAVPVVPLVGCLNAVAQDSKAPRRDPFRYSLNTSTIRGQKLPLDQEIEIAAKAGYDGFEPWLNKMEEFQKAGGSLKDMRKKCSDLGLKVISAIGFAQWIVDDDVQRAKGLEQAKRDMSRVAELGGSHIAAPPAGATKGDKLNLFAAAERFHALLEVGRQTGVIPQLEVWGFSANLSRLGETIFVATESGHPDACILPDVYHIYKGGSSLEGVRMLSRTAVHNFHINDYPADPPRETVNDSHRVYPGDGVAPLDAIIKNLSANGVSCYFSLELFHPELWKQDPLQVAQEGLKKSRASVARALGL